jgi:hypothetical protein
MLLLLLLLLLPGGLPAAAAELYFKPTSSSTQSCHSCRSNSPILATALEAYSHCWCGGFWCHLPLVWLRWLLLLTGFAVVSCVSCRYERYDTASGSYLSDCRLQ